MNYDFAMQSPDTGSNCAAMTIMVFNTLFRSDQDYISHASRSVVYRQYCGHCRSWGVRCQRSAGGSRKEALQRLLTDLTSEVPDAQKGRLNHLLEQIKDWREDPNED